MEKEKVVLAFSGGLDTSYCVKYLSEECGYDVYTAIANTGGFSPDDLKRIEERALALGAVKHATLDITQEYYEKSIRFMIMGNVLRNGTYPISVSSERIFQAIAIIEYAKQIGRRQRNIAQRPDIARRGLSHTDDCHCRHAVDAEL